MKTNVFGLPTKSSEHLPSKPSKSQIMEARKLLLAASMDQVISKAISKALNDEDKDQGSMIKLLMDRGLPLSEFEQKKDGSRTAITITIGGLNDVVVEGKPEDVEEV